MTLTTPPAVVLYILSLVTPASAMVLTLTGHLPSRITGTVVGVAFIPLMFAAFCFETGYMCWPHPWRDWLHEELHDDYHAIKTLGITRLVVATVETVGVLGVFARLFIHLLTCYEIYGREGMKDCEISMGLVLNPINGPHTRVQDMSMRAYTALLGGFLVMTAPPSLQYPWWATLVYSANIGVLLVDPLLGLAKPRLTTTEATPA